MFSSTKSWLVISPVWLRLTCCKLCKVYKQYGIGTEMSSFNLNFVLKKKTMWVRSSRGACLVTWFCYQMIAKPGNKTFVTWPMYIHPSVWPNHTIRHRITWSTLFQLMTCCLVAPSHYLSQFSIKGVLWYSQTNSTGNSQDIVLQIEFEKN